ncbi:STAS domain-containing protein [Hymenobacter busanensis]|uniref:Anti-sigma factor antagonist n=1 Tax=Hymenobacter busanensis TaxID=2607656 RepID=A0A7L4ZZQ5_9BACT|nr:STAS domain-containing protein [Hymenobacter busanensis]KAA9338567.1 STAS domain-containing protein [Hymenobacter busanensis]QHJ09004.1 anti-sigma factor antagonist [Hymenobacter busanensis]
MKIVQNADSNTLTLGLDGELDASSSVLLDAELTQPDILRHQKVMIDCQKLNYISSAGLGVFISHLQRFQDAGVKLVFFNMQEKVHNVFEILGLDSLMTIVPTQQEAAAL